MALTLSKADTKQKQPMKVRPTSSNAANGRALPVVGAVPPTAPRRKVTWRAASLILVYLLVTAHIIHWKFAGRTLAPLELSETMQTLEIGVVTAGFLFMCALMIGTLIAGRFFCSWACHMIALQDLCAWLLRKFNIKPAPIRSRVLLWVPPIAAFYMFIWPQVTRVWRGVAFPKIRLADASEGWASLITDEFWRNLPGTPIVILTFLVCGFVAVYFLGSRSFCNYVCPYGALFGWVDRLAPLRIRVTDACVHCAKCTAACPTGIRVHEEVKRHGMVVNPACMKDLDCVAACPEDALYYGAGMPALWRSRGPQARFGLKYAFTWREEILLAIVFVFSELTLRGLYNQVPFFLSLTSAGIIACVAVVAWRLVGQTNVRLANLKLKAGGRLGASGICFVAVLPLLGVFLAYAAFVRYHEFVGVGRAAALDPGVERPADDEVVRSALTHLQTARHWSPVENMRIDRRLLQVATHLREFDIAEAAGRRLLERFPDDRRARLQLGQVLLATEQVAAAQAEFEAIVGLGMPVRDDAREDLASAHQALAGLAVQRGDLVGAVAQFRDAIAAAPFRAALYQELGGLLAELGEFERAIQSLRDAVRIDDSLPAAHYNLGVLLAREGNYSEAVPSYRRASELRPNDADVQNNLGFALMRLGRDDEARLCLEAAIRIDTTHASAHFNLAMLMAHAGDDANAAMHLETAVGLDPHFLDLLADPAEERDRGRP